MPEGFPNEDMEFSPWSDEDRRQSPYNRRHSLVAVPPAMAEMIRSIAEDMETVYNHPMTSAMVVDANSLRNMADLLDRIAEQNGGKPLRIERRQS